MLSGAQQIDLFAAHLKYLLAKKPQDARNQVRIN